MKTFKVRNIVFKHFYLLIIASFFAFYLILNIFFIGSRIPISPDESQVLFFSNLFANQKTLIYKNELNHLFPEKIFAARQYVQWEDKTVPSAFLGFIFFVGIFRMVNESLIYAVGPVLAAISLFYTYKLSTLLYNHKAAIIATVLIGFFPPFIYWTLSFYNNLAEVTFLIVGIYYIFQSFITNKLKYFIFSGIAFGLALWMRYTNILMLPPFALAYLALYKFRVNYLYIFCTILTLIIICSPIAYLNKVLYGSPFIMGQSSKYQLVYSVAEDSIPTEKIPYVPFRSLSILTQNYITYLINLFPVLFAVFVFGIAINFKDKIPYYREFLALITIAIIWMLYYLGGYYFGYGPEPVLSSSYTRYLLIAYIIFIIFAAFFISKFSPTKIIFFSLVLIYFFVDLGFTSRYGLLALKGQIDSSKTWLETVTSSTEPNSIFFVKGADKILFPSRNVALYQMLSEKETLPGEGITKTASLINNLVSNYPVYIINEDNFYTGHDLDLYLKALNSYNISPTNLNGGIIKLSKQ